MWALVLSENHFYGTVPAGIENLYNLRFLQLERNHLSGPIHINFNKFQRLEVLALHANKFIRKIPSAIGNLTRLSRLIMGFNNLDGTIPPSLGRCLNLIELDLSHNFLSGSIPREIFRISKLSVSFSVASNALTGPLPSEVGLLQNLEELDFSDNRLSAKIPDSIRKCSSLIRLHLKGNSFEGEIPQAFSSLKALQELDISHNRFSGQIPNSLAELDGLNYLNLSYNQLQGEVPRRGIFLNASGFSLSGNNGLCGGITELNLPPCVASNSKKNNVAFVLKVTMPVVVAAITLALFLCFLIFYRRNRFTIKKNISMPSFEHQFLRISYSEIFKATNGFSTVNIIGAGSYGSVYKGILEQVGKEVAVKVLNLQQNGATNSFMLECQALKNAKHRNLLKLLSACSSVDFHGNDFKALIYEFMGNGSLEKWLHKDGGNLNLIQRLNIAIDIASAIEYLHNGSSSIIIHGDLKPSNVLLDNKMTAHIGDFGLAKIVSTRSGDLQQNQSSSIAIKGSIGYVAPEYGMGGVVSKEGDVYSYGIMLLEMFTGKKPTDDESFEDDMNIHNFVKRCLPCEVTEIVDSSMLSSEDGRGNFKDCLVSVLRIGVACSMDLPAERMKMEDVINELQKIKHNYQDRGSQERRRNNY